MINPSDHWTLSQTKGEIERSFERIYNSLSAASQGEKSRIPQKDFEELLEIVHNIWKILQHMRAAS